MKRDKRSPLKDEPLRLPGQSIDERRAELLDKLEIPALMAVLLVAVMVMEWSRYFNPHPPLPWIYSFFALVALLYAFYGYWRVFPELRRLRLGRDGERAVGQYLEKLRERGFEVFHDFVGDGFNVDHVLVGAEGVFTVETKTIRKASKGESTVVFDGEKILVNGFEPDRNPVVQARAQAKWLREMIAESTGKKVKVHPVIVYPGWYVEHRAPGKKDIWVLNPKMLEAFLNREQACLQAEDVKLVGFHLSRFIRGQQRAARQQ